MGRKKIRSNIQQIPFTKKTIVDKKSTGIFSEEFELVAIQNFGFDNRQNKNNNCTSTHSRPTKITVKAITQEVVQCGSHLTSKKQIREFRLLGQNLRLQFFKTMIWSIEI